MACLVSIVYIIFYPHIALRIDDFAFVIVPNWWLVISCYLKWWFELMIRFFIWCCHVLYEWVDNPLFLFLCPWAVMTCSIKSDWLKLSVNQIWVWWTVCLDDLLIRHLLHDVLRCLLNFLLDDGVMETLQGGKRTDLNLTYLSLTWHILT